jgi:sugar lactone lactonase YvrE
VPQLNLFLRTIAAYVLVCSAIAIGQQSSNPIATGATPEVATPGTISTYAGEGPKEQGYSGDGGPATKAKMVEPDGLFLDSTGNLYFTDAGTNAIREVNASTKTVTRIVGRGDCESALSDCGDGGPALKAELWSPYGGAFDSAGDLYIADTENAEVRKVDHKTGVISAVAGTSCPEISITCHGLDGYTGDNGPATEALLNFPYAVAFDTAGDLYIADGGNNAIRKVAMKTGTITTFAGESSLCAKRTDSIGDGCPAKESLVRHPWGLAFDKEGNLFIAELQHVRRVDARTGIITLYAGSIEYSVGCAAQTDRFGDGCPATERSIEPEGIALDAFGNVFVTDSLGSSGIVRRIDAETGILSLVAGGGNCTSEVNVYYCGDGDPATDAELDYPTSIAFDKAGNLFIADFHNSALREVALASNSAVQQPVFSPPAGIYHSTQSVRISDPTAHTAIHYTTDDLTPTVSSPEFGGPIAVEETTTIKAFAINAENEQSAVASATYTIRPLPVVATKAATYVETEEATLNATVNDENTAGDAWFIYGTSKTALTKMTAKRGLGASAVARTVQVALTGLKGKTTYYFQAVASTASGTVSGEILSFATN